MEDQINHPVCTILVTQNNLIYRQYRSEIIISLNQDNGVNFIENVFRDTNSYLHHS